MNGKQLKNSILQWAIQGKLVQQDPNDEPASVLLEHIREEKAKLVKEKKIKKDKNESIIYRGDDNSCYLLEVQERILKKMEHVKWVFNSKNGGFAYAMNRGIEKAVGDFLVIMNPDVRIKYGIEYMFDFLYFNEQVGIVSPKIVNSLGEVQDSFRKFLTPSNFILRQLRRIFYRRNEVITMTKLENVDWVIGAFMMISKKAYEAVCGMDEKYFLYCEDMDLCKKIHDKGYKVIYYPDAVVVYEGTRSARKSLKYACIFLSSLLHYWSKFGFKRLTSVFG